jgi:hypothetical protein
MNLRTKFFLVSFAVELAVALIVGGIVSLRYYDSFKDTSEKTLNNSLTMVTSLYPLVSDPDTLKTEGEANSAVYQRLLRELNSINQHFQLTFIYMVERLPDGTYGFLFDTDDVNYPDPTSQYFKPYRSPPDELIAALETGKDQYAAPYTDEWGSFVSLFRPIFAKDGSVRAVLGADYDYDRDQAAIRETWMSFGLALFAAFVLALALSWFASGFLLKPIREASDVLKRISGEAGQ